MGPTSGRDDSPRPIGFRFERLSASSTSPGATRSVPGRSGSQRRRDTGPRAPALGSGRALPSSTSPAFERCEAASRSVAAMPLRSSRSSTACRKVAGAGTLPAATSASARRRSPRHLAQPPTVELGARVRRARTTTSAGSTRHSCRRPPRARGHRGVFESRDSRRHQTYSGAATSSRAFASSSAPAAGRRRADASGRARGRPGGGSRSHRTRPGARGGTPPRSAGPARGTPRRS